MSENGGGQPNERKFDKYYGIGMIAVVLAFGGFVWFSTNAQKSGTGSAPSGAAVSGASPEAQLAIPAPKAIELKNGEVATLVPNSELKARQTGGGIAVSREVEDQGPAGPQPVYVAHINSVITLDIPNSSKRFAFNFGMASPSWRNGGTTMGGCFDVVFSTSAGPGSSSVFNRCLAPVTVADDRGMQAFAIDLPADAQQVLLKTSDVPGGNSSWGWTYFANVQFLK
jgi:hypothetical protein